MAWEWVPKDDSVFAALFKGSAGITDAGKSAVMLRLCLGSIRDYAREMVTAGERYEHLAQPTTILPGSGETERTDSVTSDSDSFSDEDEEECHSDLSEGAAETNAESDSNDGSGSKRGGQVGGKRARWSPLEEQRLRSWVKEDKDWPWIATRLGRTEPAVAQHWRVMNQSPARYEGCTLIACGGYNTKGSLELCGLQLGADNASDSFTARAHSKILNVITHGTRLALSDSSGNIKWFERDGLTEVRRHRIGYGDVAHQSSILSTGSDDLARKILSTAASSDAAAFNNGDILFWTGEKLGLLGFSARPGFSSWDFDQGHNQSRMAEQRNDVRFVRNLGHRAERESWSAACGAFRYPIPR
ncbi:hypothetical protein B0T17DRAFT_618572 [Bombardia bombarda]|uniref:Myb-like domain-containing protein n=1 Tax=Bombardia bombarda TaxID=252184 RepID=A0AA39WM69_9PEZI|nr:hypothetical protein B0T17DRAFT_618572 [Bombardia bombarda]